MKNKLKKHKSRFAILIFFTGILSTSIFQINGQSLKTEADPLQVYQVASSDYAYHANQFNVSLSITNQDFQDILNVSINLEVPSEIEPISSSETELDFDNWNDSDEINFNLGLVKVDENKHFSVTYNVTSSEAGVEVLIPSVNVTFFLPITGISSSVLSNTVVIGLRGKQLSTTTETINPIPSVSVFGDPIFSILGYIFPLIAFSVSIIFMRRIRYFFK
ncbi:MAG: hypothetical protein ACXAC8_13300 [Candidatus Hodarchaeales archaeon]